MWPFDADTTPSQPPDPNASPDPGRLTEAFSSPWVSVPTAVGLGLLAAASPRRGTGYLAEGINQGLQLGFGAERSNYERQKQQRLSDAVKKYAESTTTVPVTVNKLNPRGGVGAFQYQGGQAGPGGYHLSDATAPLASPQPEPLFTQEETTKEVPIYTPQQQQFLKMLAETPQGTSAALSHIAGQVFKPPANWQHVATRDGAVIAVNPQDPTQFVTVRPAQPAALKTPPRPVFSAQGGQAVSSIYNQDTGQWETTRTPLTPAPAPLEPPGLAAERAAQVKLANARVNQINDAMKLAQNAKNATVGQLATALTSLTNAQNMSMDESETELIKTARTAILEELASRRKAQAPVNIPDPPKGKMVIQNTKTGDMGFYPIGKVPTGFIRLK